jgi:hypothetical protein
MSVLWAIRIAAGLILFAFGFSVAWHFQALRIVAGQQAHTKYVQAQQQRAIDAEKAANDYRDKAASAWAANLNALRARYRSGWVPVMPAGRGLQLPAARRTDDSRADAIPAPTGDAAASCEASRAALAEDAAVTTGMLNALQDDLAKYESRTRGR